PAGVEMVLVQPARKAPVPAGAMRQQIVMKTANVPADARRVTVLRARRIILVPGRVQRFRNQRALNRNVLRPTRADRLIHRPTDRTMVDDAVVARSQAHPVQCLARRVPGRTRTYRIITSCEPKAPRL